MRRQSDGRLVARARAGDDGAVDELFRRHWRPAWRRAFAVAGRAAVADDVAQETLVRLLGRLDELDEPERFGAWVRRAVTRGAIDSLRRERRLLELDESLVAAPEWVDRAGEAGDMQRRVAALDPDRRAVVVMRYWLEMTPGEIADGLDVPVGTVHSRLARALDDLRAAMAGEAR